MNEIVLHLDDEEFATLSKLAFTQNHPIQDQLNHILRHALGLERKPMRELGDVVQILISESETNEPPLLVTLPIEDYSSEIEPIVERDNTSEKNEFEVKQSEYGVTTVSVIS